jgi:hypothetical protein
MQTPLSTTSSILKLTLPSFNSLEPADNHRLGRDRSLDDEPKRFASLTEAPGGAIAPAATPLEQSASDL